MTCGELGNLRDELLPMVNELRQLPTAFGIRLYTVTMRVSTWNKVNTVFDVPGEGTETITDYPLVLDGYGGTTQPKVTKLTTRDIIASGGLYTDGDYKVDFITPQFVSEDCLGSFVVGGVPVSGFELDKDTVATQITYVLTGPEFPFGALFKKVETWTSNPFTYSFVLRKIGVPT